MRYPFIFQNEVDRTGWRIFFQFSGQYQFLFIHSHRFGNFFFRLFHNHGDLLRLSFDAFELNTGDRRFDTVETSRHYGNPELIAQRIVGDRTQFEHPCFAAHL
ncbi:hypothetical protein D3C87_1501760 [compost metagenome]